MKNCIPTVIGLIGCLATAAGSLLSAPAIAGEYGAANLGGSYSLTWRFLDVPAEGDVVGYACITKDALEGMPRTISIDRYQIVEAVEMEPYPDLQPLSGVSIRREGRSLIAQRSQPTPASAFLDRLELNAANTWYVSDLPVAALG